MWRDLLEFLAVLAAALFAGAALYVNLVEHPARMRLDMEHALAQWAPSYHRATRMQAPLALLSLVAGLGVWVLGGGRLWAIAALLIGSVVPFTLLVIMPTNHALEATDKERASPANRALLDRWAGLHSVRTALGLLATAVYLVCLIAR